MLTLCKNATMVEKSIRKYSTPAVDASLHRKKTKKKQIKSIHSDGGKQAIHFVIKGLKKTILLKQGLDANWHFIC